MFALAAEQGTLRVHAATDLAAMEPLIRDFQMISPHVSIEYVEYQTVDLYAQAQADCRAKRGSMDWRAAPSIVGRPARQAGQRRMRAGDLLAFCGAAACLDPLAKRDLWIDLEPAVIVYNPDLVPPEDVRHTRAELIDLLRAKPERYSGRIGAYDIEQSGIGYLFAIYDSRGTTVYGRLLEALARTRVATACCTADLLSALSAGRLAIGYNLLGSYAVATVRRGARLRNRFSSHVISRSFSADPPLCRRTQETRSKRLVSSKILSSPRGQRKAQ